MIVLCMAGLVVGILNRLSDGIMGEVGMYSD